MCCLTTLFLVLISRIGILLWWLTNPQAQGLAFKNWTLPGNWTFPSWLWTLVGAVVLPWTTLAYLIVFQGGIYGYKWIVLGGALLIDLASHGGSYYHRDRIRRLSKK